MAKYLLCILTACLTALATVAQKPATVKSDSLAVRTYLATAATYGTMKRDSCLLAIDKGLQIALKMKNKRLEAACYQALGVYSAAYGVRFDNQMKALRIYEELNDLNETGNVNIALWDLVRLQSNNKYPPEVLRYAERALDVFQQTKNQTGIIQANNSFGIYYAMTSQPDKALTYFEKVRDMMVTLKRDSSQIYNIEYNMANLLSKTNPQESLRRRLIIYDFFRRHPSTNTGIHFSLLEAFCQTYSNQPYTNPDEVIRYATEGLKFGQKLNNLGRQLSFHRHLQWAYKSQQQFDKALRHAELARALSDSISKQEDARQIADVQQKYDNEKKQTEIERQRRQLLEKQVLLEQSSRQKAQSDHDLRMNRQLLATQRVQQLLKEAKLTQQSQVQIANIQRLKLEKQQAETNVQLTREEQKTARNQLWGSVAAGLIMLLLAGLLWRNRLLNQKNTELQAALVKGQSIERKRVAADLHDNLGSALSSLQWSIEAIDHKKLSTPEQAIWNSLQQQVSKAYADVRLLSHNLLPDELAQHGLVPALTSLVEKLNRNKQVAFTLQLPDTLPPVAPNIAFEVYSICLELCTNILKHAKASAAIICLEQTNTTALRLTVQDNGIGLANNPKKGFGLNSIDSRIQALHASWTVSGETHEGTR
ncbi:sensor histidine kinase, partial [Arsenicibacter rosenii]